MSPQGDGANYKYFGLSRIRLILSVCHQQGDRNLYVCFVILALDLTLNVKILSLYCAPKSVGDEIKPSLSQSINGKNTSFLTITLQ